MNAIGQVNQDKGELPPSEGKAPAGRPAPARAEPRWYIHLGATGQVYEMFYTHTDAEGNYHYTTMRPGTQVASFASQHLYGYR